MHMGVPGAGEGARQLLARGGGGSRGASARASQFRGVEATSWHPPPFWCVGRAVTAGCVGGKRAGVRGWEQQLVPMIRVVCVLSMGYRGGGVWHVSWCLRHAAPSNIGMWSLCVVLYVCCLRDGGMWQSGCWSGSRMCACVRAQGGGGVLCTCTAELAAVNHGLMKPRILPQCRSTETNSCRSHM